MKLAKLFFTRLRPFPIPLGAYWFLLLLFFEGTLRLAGTEPFWGIGLCFIAVFSAAFAALLWLICSFFSAAANRRIICIFSVILYLLYASQLIYYTVFHTFYTLFSAANGGQVLDYLSVILTAIASRIPYLLLMALPLLWLIKPLMGACPQRSGKAHLLLLGATVTLQLFAIFLLPLFGHGLNTPYALYYNTRVLNASVDRLGLLTTMRHDAQDRIFGFEETPVEPDSSNLSVSTEQAADTEPSSPYTVGNPNYVRTPNVLDIDFSALAAADKGTTYEALDSYFASVEPSYTNEMTGLFQGKNLIFVVAESFSPYAIREDLTPTLYRMQQEGFQFNNYYTGIWGVSTLDGEYTADLGLVPVQGIWSMYEMRNHRIPFTLGNQFTALGVPTYAYHNGTNIYYGRNESHPNLGYPKWTAVGSGLDLPNQWPRSDYDLVDITTADYMNDPAFHVYYLTISGHLPYTVQGDQMAAKNWSYVENLPYSDNCKGYLAGNIELDRAMQLLLERLEEAGHLEDTVIAVVPDHYPYGLTNEEISEFLGHSVDPYFELYKSCFLLYNAATPPQTVTKYCSNLDVLPTLSNLFGLPYDSRLLSGHDIFSDSDPLVMLVDHSFLTDKARYNAVTGVVTTYSSQADSAYIESTMQDVTNRFQYARKILETDYYRHLGL